MKNIIILIVLIFVLAWSGLLYTTFFASTDTLLSKEKVEDINSRKTTLIQNNIELFIKQSEQILIPDRKMEIGSPLPPPNLDEVRKNMTLYLQTLHTRLAALAGPTITAQVVWDEFFDVTRSMPMHWDDLNRDRYHIPRDDNSIFVGLVTYRDPYCPMTIKSLYSQARHPEKLFIVLFQQNCFEKVCRTGVLKGGIVENADTDIDCYSEFCKSPEGIRSNACNTGQVRLFNVNESESLGPYMARYLAVKFYQGEQYYLQIDSHSEFVENWDDKLIKMVRDAPAKNPVISCYPPDSTNNWKDSIGFRICDSEYAHAQIEWQIIRLGSGMQFDHSFSKVPIYAPFVAAGFFFGSASLLREVIYYFI
jgi:hypothetical protein